MPAAGPEWLTEYRRLVELDVPEALARALVESLAAAHPGVPSPDARRLLAIRLAERFPVAASGAQSPEWASERASGRATVVAFVGPTGAGKTSLLLRFAAELAMRRKLRVGILNEDTSRPGAEAQLRNLCDLFSIRLVSANGADQVSDARRAFTAHDVLLVDTAGRSPRDEAGLQELASALRGAEADETHLVLSACQSARSMAAALAAFPGYDRVAFTKLDEAGILGHLAGLSFPEGKGVSYVTTGRDIMDTLVPATGEWLAERILASEGNSV